MILLHGRPRGLSLEQGAIQFPFARRHYPGVPPSFSNFGWLSALAEASRRQSRLEAGAPRKQGRIGDGNMLPGHWNMLPGHWNMLPGHWKTLLDPGLLPRLRVRLFFVVYFCFVLLAQSVPGALAQGTPQPSLNRPKIALVLGGGGARGAAHVGVLRELERAGIRIDMITGTSIGAIVGGLYCAGLSVDEIESKFRKPTIMRNYMTVPLVVSVVARPIFLLPRLIGIRPYDGFYWGNKFRNYYRSCLPKDRQNIEDLKIPFKAMTVNLMTGEPYAIGHGDLPRAVQASSAIPVLRRPVPFEDVLLVDGAVLINVPVDEARAMGADFVIAVPVNERLNFQKRNYFRRLGSVARRIEKIFLAKTDLPQLSRADIVIHPQTDGIDILSTSPKDADRAIDAGEEAARAVMPAIKAKLANWHGSGPARPSDKNLVQ